MLVTAKKSFNIDIEKIKDKKIVLRIKNLIVSLLKVYSIESLPNVKKMKGASNAFRIKLGDYKLGFFLKGDTLEFTAFAHRKDIYKYFP